ncbi:MAG: hypothetical protein FWC44_00865, partial [Methanomassiliicoccaceae archaeon]|nr:hypothetical protein [Methanomassiliicoccaceae archaeon]
MSKTNSGNGRLSKIGSAPEGLNRYKKKIAFVAVLLLTVTAMAVFAEESETTEAAPVSAAVVKADIEAMSDGDVYLIPGEPDGVVTLNITDNNNRTIDGSLFTLPANSGVLHFSITNTGTGTITFVNMTLNNPGALANSGGMWLNGGNYVFENCTFIGLTNTAVFFNGTSNNADFIDCTFKNNTARGIGLSSGTASSPAEFNIGSCYFDSNTITNGRGSAIGMSGGTVVNATINIFDSLFTNNRAIGTSTAHGGNNAVDGGAVAVVAGGGHLTVTLNIWNSYFENNFAQDDGGAVLVEGYAAFGGRRIASNIWNCTFTGNKAAGATYFGNIGIFNIGITNGSGGAISYYGLTDSTITNCTFYNNGITNEINAGVINCGNAGGGGAIGVDTNDGITDPAGLPPVPILSNNIFVGNYVRNSIYQTNTVLGYNITTMFGVIPTAKTGNVFVMTGADSDRQNPVTIARPLSNNGNLGYDNGNAAFDIGPLGSGLMGITYYANDLGTSTSQGLTVQNVFVNVVAGVPVKENLGAPVGAAGNTGQRYYYMPSPITDELYRDGSGPYYDSTFTTVDALGNPRDVFP